MLTYVAMLADYLHVGSQLAPLLGKVSQRSQLLSILRVKLKIPPLCTLLFYQIESLKNGASLVLPSSLFRDS